MRRAAPVILLGYLLACSSVTKHSGAAPDAVAPDADPAPDSVPEDQTSPFACTLTATITFPSPADSTLPPTILQTVFSVFIDHPSRTLWTGGMGQANHVPLERQGNSWIARSPVKLAYPVPGYGNSVLFRYDQFSLSPSATGCTGSGLGTATYTYDAGDVFLANPFTATFVGVPDRAPPTSLPRLPAIVHPMDPVVVNTDELLPVGTRLALADSAAGQPVWASSPGTDLAGVSTFSFPVRALAFGTAYDWIATPAWTDLAGNPGTLPALRTPDDPGLFAQDGFEGPLSAYLAGKAVVVDTSQLPVPGGTRAILIPPVRSESPTSEDCQSRFTARLAVAPGNTKVTVRFQHAFPISKVTFWPHHVGPLRLAAPGGSWKEYPLPGTNPFPSGASLKVEALDLELSPIGTMEFPLPPDTTTEVMFDLQNGCRWPGAVISGMLLDDLRVE